MLGQLLVVILAPISFVLLQLKKLCQTDAGALLSLPN